MIKYDNNHPLVLASKSLEKNIVKHTRFDDACKQILQLLLFPNDIKIIWVIGPTGVGKTCLAYRLRAMIQSHPALQALVAANPGCLSSVLFEVPCISTNHRFAWSSFYHTYYDELECPFNPTSRVLKDLPNPKNRYTTPEDLVLNALKYRSPLATLLDEANHFATVASGKSLIEQMNRIKSFVNRSGVLHICFGTYELAKLMNLSGQLARRGAVIHFRRYTTSEEDIKSFRRVVANFQTSIPVAHHFSLVGNTKYLHERSIGCAGTLKSWLTRALAHAFECNRQEIQMEDLEATALTLTQLKKMLEEAIKGEAALADGTEEDLNHFRTILGHSSDDGTVGKPELDLFGHPIKTPGKEPRPSTAKPFEQAPVRRPTGAGRREENERLAS